MVSLDLEKNIWKVVHRMYGYDYQNREKAEKKQRIFHCFHSFYQYKDHVIPHTE